MSIEPLDERIDYDKSIYELVSPELVDANVLHVEIEFPITVDKLTAIKQVEELVKLADDNSDIEITSWSPSLFEKGHEL
jgi:hypothetical protein